MPLDDTPPDSPPPDGGTPAPRIYAIPFEDTNARSAYIVTNNDAEEYGGIEYRKTKLGQAASTITRDGGSPYERLSYDPGTTEIHPVEADGDGVGPYLIADSPGVVWLTKIPDADGDGVNDDSFLVLIDHTPDRNKEWNTEFSAAYVGQRTPTSFLDPLASNDHKATYKGTAFVLGAIGSDSFDHSGELSMTASFGNTGTDAIKGKISNFTVPPADFDNLTFTGQLTNSLNDFGIKNIMLNQGDTAITKPGESAGIGSFVGSKAGGTMGAFSSSQTLLDGTTPVNTIGHFHGTTTDNN